MPTTLLTISRSIRSQMFFKIDVLKNFSIFTGKHKCSSLLLKKLQALRSEHRLEQRFEQICFPVNIAKFFKALFSTEHFRSSHSVQCLPVYYCNCYKYLKHWHKMDKEKESTTNNFLLIFGIFQFI